MMTEVRYGDHPARALDLYSATAPSQPLIVFIHGGAWRAEDKAHHADMAKRLAARTGCAVAVPNYRLTPSTPGPDDPAVHHPAHAEDVLAALTHLHSAKDPDYDRSQLYLMGHSCGAHMLSSIFLDSGPVTPSLTPSPSLLAAVRAIVVSEGIYDFDILLNSFPKYRDWFISNAFGDHPSYTPWSTTQFPLRENGSHIQWLVVHSKGDTLVDLPQSRSFYDHICKLYSNAGEIVEEKIKWDQDSLTQDHNAILLTTTFTDLVSSFLKSLGN